ncbi:GNAT family N-acetyltransferase [Celeribacter sp.]|uniref:GNAT family N-acetyltransferase n=1 Tax=Celeribacter sp. TaxID=1890673 RepID=UPI003A90BB7C
MTQAPTITTPRLTLRAPRLEDFETYADFCASARSVYMDGPHDREKAWAWFCNDTAHWALFGYGGLMIEVDGALAGQVAVTKGIGFPETELGWFLFDGFEGQGYAAEAAFALRDWVYENTDLDTLVSYVSPQNTASAALAERLGATRDVDAARPAGETADDCIVFRHPSPAELRAGGMEAYA